MTVEEYRDNLIHAMHEAGRDEFIALVVLPNPFEFQHLKNLLKNYSRRREGEWHTDHGYIWLCPECGLPVHSDYDGCPRCGHKKDDTWRK